MSEIALDLYLLRLITPIQTKLQNAVNGVETSQEDIDLAVALVDEWGRGFVAETDYRLEAKNTMEFEAAMRSRNLDAVCAPTVVEELVRDKVLVTEWVQGTRLDLDARYVVLILPVRYEKHSRTTSNDTTNPLASYSPI